MQKFFALMKLSVTFKLLVYFTKLSMSSTKTSLSVSLVWPNLSLVGFNEIQLYFECTNAFLDNGDNTQWF